MYMQVFRCEKRQKSPLFSKIARRIHRRSIKKAVRKSKIEAFKERRHSSSWKHRASTRLFHRIRFCAVLFAPSHVMLAFPNSFSIDLLQVCLVRPCPSTLMPFVRCYQVVFWACGLSIATFCAWFAAVRVPHLSSSIALRCWWCSARIFCRWCGGDICLQKFEASVWWNWRLTMFHFRTTILTSHMN